MKKITITKDIRVFFITATSFPGGVLAAHQKLHSMLPSDDTRNFYGISHGTETGIIYKAAAEEVFRGEGAKLGCETFTIPCGDYLCETLTHWCDEPGSVGKIFSKLLADPRLDDQGFCLEKYLNDTDMQCMVRIKDGKL